VNPDCCQYDHQIIGRPGKPPVKHAKPSAPPEIEKPPLQPTISWNPLGISDAEERLLELRLLHHYTKTTCNARSLSSMVPVLCHPMWEIDIPQIAFSSEIVLNALLALSSLHLLALTPNDPILPRASRSYLDKAITKHQVAITQVDQHNVEPLLVAAVLIAHHTWLTAHSKGTKERYNIDLQTYHMCNGIKALVERTKHWLPKYDWPRADHKKPQVDDLAKKRFMHCAMQDLDLLSTTSRKSNTPFEDKAAYQAAVDELIAIYSMIATESDISKIEQNIVTLLHRLPPQFLPLLEREDPIAMALLARNLSMLSLLERSSAWWLHGAGENKVAIKAVLGIRGLMPSDWLWTMEWPLNVIAKKIKLDSDWPEDGIYESFEGEVKPAQITFLPQATT
jgi:hypothetical protein